VSIGPYRRCDPSSPSRTQNNCAPATVGASALLRAVLLWQGCCWLTDHSIAEAAVERAKRITADAARARLTLRPRRECAVLSGLATEERWKILRIVPECRRPCWYPHPPPPASLSPGHACT